MNQESETTLLTRRSWLQGTALVALYAWATAGARATIPALDSLQMDAIVIDAGLSDSATLARAARTQARVEMLYDDVAALFYQRLCPTWCEHGVRGIAGLTRATALFLLEPLASEFGLRTVGLQRTPLGGCMSLTSLCERPARAAVSPEPMEKALLEDDHAAFAWVMAPVKRPLRAGVRVVTV